MGQLEVFLRFAIAGGLAGLGAAWFVARAIYHAGKVAGYLERRNFLVKRRLLLRTAVWVDGHPLDDVGAVWIQTNGFDEWERERIRQLAHAEA